MDFHDFLNPKEVLQNILEVLHCPFCGSDYLEKNTKLKAQFDKDYVVHLFCSQCQNSIVASFSYKDSKGVFGQNIGGKAGMPITEMMGYIKKGTICDDDVLDFYKGIKDFDGNFQKIFPIKRARRTRNIN